LVSSFAARAIAVRKVTTNKGKNTAGVDNKLLISDSAKMKAIGRLKNLKVYKPYPVKRI
jgi:RNA-directed DNA polymerase